MFKVLILICAANLDHAACTPKTATNVIRGPVAQTMAQCIHESQTTLAQTGIAPPMEQGYMKIVCQGAANS